MPYDLDAYRRLFPVCERIAYFDHAGVAPCSTRTRDAVRAWVDDLTEVGFRGDQRWEDSMERVRERAARLLGASPGEIAFVRSTAHGLSLFAEGLAWSAGDEVIVCCAVEYPSNTYTWKHLADRGVVVREVAPSSGGGVTVDAIAEAITERTRLVAASTVQFATGHRTDIEAVGALCRERGALLCVDGIQSVGAFPIDVKRAGVSALSADSHKWMLGLVGVGILFVDAAVIDRVRPVLVGWRSTADPWAFDGTRFELRADARKFEEGSVPHALIDGFGEALALAEEIGVDRIGAHISGLLDRAEAGLVALGCRVTPPRGERAGILLFAPPDGDAERVFLGLKQAGFALALRRGMVRIAPHLYNSDAEIDRLLEAVGSLLA